MFLVSVCVVYGRHVSKHSLSVTQLRYKMLLEKVLTELVLF